MSSLNSNNDSLNRQEDKKAAFKLELDSDELYSRSQQNDINTPDLTTEKTLSVNSQKLERKNS